VRLLLHVFGIPAIVDEWSITAGPSRVINIWTVQYRLRERRSSRATNKSRQTTYKRILFMTDDAENILKVRQQDAYPPYAPLIRCDIWRYRNVIYLQIKFRPHILILG